MVTGHLYQMSPFPLAMKSNPECIALKDPVKAEKWDLRIYQAFYQTKQRDRFKMDLLRHGQVDLYQIGFK
jgi:hypothetical protein